MNEVFTLQKIYLLSQLFPKVGSGDPQRWNQFKLRMKSEGWNLADTAYDMQYIKSRLKYIIDVTMGYDGQ